MIIAAIINYIVNRQLFLDMEKSVQERAEDIAEFIAGSRTYEEAIATVNVGYEHEQQLSEHGYTVGDLLATLQKFEETDGKIDILLVTKTGNIRAAVLTLEITTMIRAADDCESVGKRIQRRYSSIEQLYSQSIGEYSVEQVVKPLRNMDQYSYRNITSSCDMRQAVKDLDEQ